MQMEPSMHYRKSFSHYALLTLLGSFSSISYADTTMMDPVSDNASKPVELILGFALSAGGDDLAKIDLVDGSGHTRSENIEAGGLWYIYGGVQFDTPFFPLRLTLGYFEDGVDASNGSVSFSRVPLELLGVFSSGPHSFGVGPTLHLSPELDMKDVGLGSYEADDALGLVLMYEYTFENNFALGARYTNISYDFGGDDVDGSNLGLLLEMKF
jgi:hypothetical protein